MLPFGCYFLTQSAPLHSVTFFPQSDVDVSVSVTTENVDCFDSGVICRKSLVISIGKSIVAFDDDSGKPVGFFVLHSSVSQPGPWTPRRSMLLPRPSWEALPWMSVFFSGFTTPIPKRRHRHTEFSCHTESHEPDRQPARPAHLAGGIFHHPACAQ